MRASILLSISQYKVAGSESGCHMLGAYRPVISNEAEKALSNGSTMARAVKSKFAMITQSRRLWDTNSCP